MTADLAASYGKALRAHVPQARVVYDRFHVERLAADVVDEVRRTEQRRLGKTSGKTLKSTRYALLKHPARLMRRQNRALDRAYELKEYLATILEQAQPSDADELLDQWLDWAARSRLVPFVRLARTIRTHAAGILAYLDTRMTNRDGREINNKLRVIARRAYGSHSYGPLISMPYLCCGGIEPEPAPPHDFEETRRLFLIPLVALNVVIAFVLHAALSGEIGQLRKDIRRFAKRGRRDRRRPRSEPDARC